MALVPAVTWILSTLTLASDIFLASLLISWLFLGKKAKPAFSFFGKNAVLFSFIVSAAATLGSLFFSEVAKYTPCYLCWFQRIFMYPMAFIFLIGLLTKRDPFPFALPLASIGVLIAFYHYWLQASATTCAEGSACVSVFFRAAYGYVTIPMMAMTAFLMVIAFSMAGKEKI
jgi:hypothetical protein